MYQFVRDYLRLVGGRCSRSELLAAMQADGRIALRLSRSQGFDALLKNMQHSRELAFENDDVVATPRALRRRPTA